MTENDDIGAPELQAESPPAKRGRISRTAALEQSLKEREDRYLRLAADFDNLKRRSAQELLDRGRYGAEDAALALLPVLDNLRRAVEHADSSGDQKGATLLDGLKLVVREFELALERIGVMPIDAVGTPFDPAVHDAIAADESPDVEVETVVAEMQRGYRLHDRVLRPAMVRIARPSSG